ncbi:hypothetical protein ACFV3R_14210 [Streptomyces sp. NPDC059740]|uniref:hypothetical protein n=1 Tax=Streptomyces sp. NPDC059740 TaxID=3346926 RepID=UPI0036535505
MTAPQPPSEPPSERAAHAATEPPPGATPAGHPAPRTGAAEALLGPRPAVEAARALLIAAVLTACGLLLGLLWAHLAPAVPLVSDGQDVYYKDTEGEQAIGADGTFALLGLAFGLLSALVVFLLRRKAGVLVVVGLVVGGLAGSFVGREIGQLLGPAADVAAHARQLGKGVVFGAPLRLQARGVLLAWPVGAVIGQLLLTGFFGPRDPEPWQPSLDAAQWPQAAPGGGGAHLAGAPADRQHHQEGDGTAPDGERPHQAPEHHHGDHRPPRP